MELNELLEKRLIEVVSITKIISTEASEYQFRNEQLIKEIKESGDSQEDIEKNRTRVREMKKMNSLAYLKSSEVQINVRVMNEIYSIIKFMGITPNLSEQDIEILEFNLANVKPTFVLDKNEVVFFDKDSEGIMMEKLNQPTEKEDEMVQKIKNFR